jgi:hypothetical protein
VPSPTSRSFHPPVVDPRRVGQELQSSHAFALCTTRGVDDVRDPDQIAVDLLAQVEPPDPDLYSVGA